MARPRSDIEPRIVLAARARFLAAGVDGASLREIAADAGTSIGMIHYYFASKDDLFLAVVEEIYAKLLVDIEEALAGDDAVRARLRRVFLRLSRASAEELDTVRLILREALVSSERLGRLLERFQRGHLPLVLSALREGVARGELDPSIPTPLLLVCTAGIGVVPQLVVGVAGRRLPGFAQLAAGDALVDALVELLFRAIGAPPARRRRA